MAEPKPPRERVINALSAAIAYDDEEAVAELWSAATPDEKRAVADRQGSVASLLEDRAAIFRALALKQALDLIGPYWPAGKPLSTALKTAPQGVASRALSLLRDFDWLSEEDAS